MTVLTYNLKDIRRHRSEIDASKQDDDTRRLLGACRGELRIHISGVVHGHDGMVGLPRTACGIRHTVGAWGLGSVPAGHPNQ